MQKILKVRFDHITLDQATETALQWSQSEDQRYITTPNPEIVLEAQKNKKFLRILNRSDLNIADGTGILWASKFLKITENNKFKIIKFIYSLALTLIYPKYIRTELPERVTGVDLMENICKKSNENLKIFLLGSENGVADQTKKVLESKYKNINIVDTYEGSPNQKDEKEIVKIIKSSEANMLFVAYGAPAQEMWIKRNIKKIQNIKVAIGVGGSFDFISGKQKRAPIWMRKTGLEWLYRLLQQPKRVARIYRATLKFPIKVLKFKTLI